MGSAVVRRGLASSKLRGGLEDHPAGPPSVDKGQFYSGANRAPSSFFLT
jgi:hypothetical protein